MMINHAQERAQELHSAQTITKSYPLPLFRCAAVGAGCAMRSMAVPALMKLAGGQPAFSSVPRVPVSFAASGLGPGGNSAGLEGVVGSTGEVAESSGEGTSAVSTGSTTNADSNALEPRRRRRKL
jgi:hypothetical protein